MDKEFYEEIAKRCLDSGTSLHYLVRDIKSAVAHEAMLRSEGYLKGASIDAGISRVSLGRYLGMGSREWKKRYGGKDE